MDIEELLKAAESKRSARVAPAPEPPKAYYPSQCSSSLLREIIRRSKDHKDDPEVALILRSIKSRTKIVGGDERLRRLVERLKNEPSPST
jgi:hypothetical protein